MPMKRSRIDVLARLAPEPRPMLRACHTLVTRATPLRGPAGSLLLTALLSTSVATSGCGQGAQTPNPLQGVVDVTATQDSALRVLSTQTSGFTEPMEMVLRDEQALAGAWSTAHLGLPGNPPPSVEFSRESVVLLAIGERNTAGHGARLDGIAREADRAVVRYTVTAPGPDCMTAQMMTSPAVAYRVPRMPQDVRFERSEARVPC